MLLELHQCHRNHQNPDGVYFVGTLVKTEIIKNKNLKLDMFFTLYVSLFIIGLNLAGILPTQL